MSVGCKHAILLICYIFVYIFLNWKKCHLIFGLKQNWKNSNGFPIQFELLDAKTNNVISEGVEFSTKFNLVVLDNNNGVEMEVEFTKENWNELDSVWRTF